MDITQDLKKPAVLHCQEIPKYRVIILGAGRNIRGATPSALVNIDSSHCVLDWILDTFSVLPDVHFDFVAGYKANDIAPNYQNIHFSFNPEWKTTGPIHSLRMVSLKSEFATYICYADIIFRKNIIQAMESRTTDILYAVDTLWRKRYPSASRPDIDSREKSFLRETSLPSVNESGGDLKKEAQFAGLLKITGPMTAQVEKIVHSSSIAPNGKLSGLIDHFSDQGLSLQSLDLKGDWAELDAPQDIARFILGTKAESLERLRPIIRKGKISKQVSFDVAQWEKDSNVIINKIIKEFQQTSLIIRSSALSEDAWHASSAGVYKSILDIPSSDSEKIRNAVSEVIASYNNNSKDDQVLIQAMLKNVKISGVVMTRTLIGAPYYLINYDDTSSRTDNVTSGKGQALRTIILHRKASLNSNIPVAMHSLLEAIQDLEELVGHDSLDIEFAITQDDDIHILQIRPLAAAHSAQFMDDTRLETSINDCVKYYHQLNKRHPFLFGDKTIFTVMSDWNPAEMIGTKPNQLAFSLYRHLISDETWAQQRAEYGYCDVRPANLIVDFLGHPYVDTRVAFNSVIPASLPDDLSERLANYYLDRLKNNPSLHDKVEFEITFNCMTFDFDQKSEKLRKAGFSQTDIKLLKSSLVKITQDGMKRCQHDLTGIQQMSQRFEKIMSGNFAPLDRVYFLLEDTRRIGILLFAHLARNAFVAVSLLNSLKTTGCLSDDDIESFWTTINTVSKQMQNDAHDVADNRMTWDSFVEKYGHLRPGSYDITSMCYKDAPKEFLRPIVASSSKRKTSKRKKSWDDATYLRISQELKKIGLDIKPQKLEEFFKTAIEGREMGKFIFMRNLNAALKAIEEFGTIHGLDKNELSHIRISDFFNLRGQVGKNIADALSDLVEQGKDEYDITQSIYLPSQITCASDFHCIQQFASEPNYVTQKKILAPVMPLSLQNIAQEKVEGTIVLIPNADPGFDWLFSRNIAGLITMYGGVNSHMAIRAAEFRLPAAIGVGELLFEKLNQAEMIEIDCRCRRIKIVR